MLARLHAEAIDRGDRPIEAWPPGGLAERAGRRSPAGERVWCRRRLRVEDGPDQEVGMTTVLDPHLAFGGDAREAMTFSQSVLGGELTMSAFGDMGIGGPDEAQEVMHAQLRTQPGHTLTAADTPMARPSSSSS